MKRLLQKPAFNAVCISLFTGFYSLLFFTLPTYVEPASTLPNQGNVPFWALWGSFLSAGGQAGVAWVLIALTVWVVVLLLTGRRPYDEYDASSLTGCLLVALVLTLAAIAIFYGLILIEPVAMMEKFTLFIAIHWATVVLSNLVYVLVCRRR